MTVLSWTKTVRKAQNRVRWRKLVNGLCFAVCEVPKEVCRM